MNNDDLGCIKDDMVTKLLSELTLYILSPCPLMTSLACFCLEKHRWLIILL